MLLNITTGFSNLKTVISLTEGSHSKEKRMLMNQTWITLEKDSFGGLESICKFVRH